MDANKKRKQNKQKLKQKKRGSKGNSETISHNKDSENTKKDLTKKMLHATASTQLRSKVRTRSLGLSPTANRITGLTAPANVDKRPIPPEISSNLVSVETDPPSQTHDVQNDSIAGRSPSSVLDKDVLSDDSPTLPLPSLPTDSQVRNDRSRRSEPTTAFPINPPAQEGLHNSAYNGASNGQTELEMSNESPSSNSSSLPVTLR